MRNHHTDNYGATTQIMPAAPGWKAVYAGAEEGYQTIPLVCWALVQWVEEGGGTVTTGLIADPGSGELAYASEPDSFLGYTYPEDLSDWDARAQRYRARRKKC